MSYLNKAKNILTSTATDIFNDMRHELDDFSDYAEHYSWLGETLANIDQISDFQTLLKKVMDGEFRHLGVFVEDDECIENFFENIFGKSC
jgi:hypothetical protein